MEQIQELRKIMDEFVEVECAIEGMITILKICESYCEDKSDAEGIAITNVTRRQLELLYCDLKSSIIRLDKHIIVNRRKYQN